MRISCVLRIVDNPSDLPVEALPGSNIVFTERSGSMPHIELFRTLMDKFNLEGDALLSGIFKELLSDEDIVIPVIATWGIPDPYDAWCATFNNEKSFFFNLSRWDDADLKRAGLAVILHETTHVLVDKIHRNSPDRNRPLEVLDYIVFNEGIAHFIGFPGNRSKICELHRDKWRNAEKTLTAVRDKLSDPNVSQEEINRCLYEANTGSFWKKYGSIAGLCRVSWLYEKHGLEAIVECIRSGSIPEIPEVRLLNEEKL